MNACRAGFVYVCTRNIGGGNSGEGRVGSLERPPPPPPHSHSISHNVGNLLHMAGSFIRTHYDYRVKLKTSH